MLWCTAPVLSSMAQHLFYLLATNLLPHLPSCSALPHSSTLFPSLTSPYTPNLCPAGRQWPKLSDNIRTPIRYFLIYVYFLSRTSLSSFSSLSLPVPLFTRTSVHLSLFSTTPSIQMPIFPSHYSLGAGLPVPLCFWLSLQSETHTSHLLLNNLNSCSLSFLESQQCFTLWPWQLASALFSYPEHRDISI